MAKLAFPDLGLLAAYAVCRVLPIDWVSAFGAWRGRYRGAQLQELEARARANLAIIAPDQDPARVLAQLRRESGRAALEVLIADRIARARRVHWQASPEFEAVVAQKRSVVFALPHLCNLGDVLGGSLIERHSHFVFYDGITRKFQNPTMRWLMDRCRANLLQGRRGRIHAPDPGMARRVLKNLANGPSALFIHIDEARGKQVPFPGFGRPIADKGLNVHYAIRFARRSGAVLVPATMHREPGRAVRFTARPLAVWDMASTSASDAEVLAQMQQAFEAEIATNPSDWLNIYHRRP